MSEVDNFHDVDIVELLRAWTELHFNDPLLPDHLVRAADEIDRLRRDNQALRDRMSAMLRRGLRVVTSEQDGAA
jgi:hypothetical protein